MPYYYPSPGGYNRFVSKASSYTVLISDCGTLFNDLGSTAQVVFTLPSAPPNGFYVGFITTFTGGTARIKAVASGVDKMYWSNSATACTSAVCNSSHGGYGQTIGLVYLTSSTPASGLVGWYSIYGYIYDWTFS